ncbi:DinB family protein [Stackebrandtia albiflava]|uniref:DinB family protein n=1 Tax=Stackebrandtia albiflava TaxID=406432 RepID=A0A562V1V8_9ACTN|nr:DinB family protein [Stackebrandtia albiflava]TWJ11787.1 DinB family protein [Stackebrandtia albiflava]
MRDNAEIWHVWRSNPVASTAAVTQTAGMRRLLRDQLAIPWRLATEHVLPGLTEDMLHRPPSPRAVGVRPVEGRWRAELPDETAVPPPEPTAAWLLWHVEWWWGAALASVRGGPASPPDAQEWSGDLATSVGELHRMHDEWDAVLRDADLARPCTGGILPDWPLSRVAAWLNVELTKNVAELGVLGRRFAGEDHPM